MTAKALGVSSAPIAPAQHGRDQHPYVRRGGADERGQPEPATPAENACGSP
jgi:hypothetical protein